MAVTLDRAEMLRLARLGAEARLQAIEKERQQILRSFPGLRAGASAPAAGQSATASASRGRKPMSAAARKAVSARMKKYWAERRAKKGKG